jgi:hypothetical protein
MESLKYRLILAAIMIQQGFGPSMDRTGAGGPNGTGGSGSTGSGGPGGKGGNRRGGGGYDRSRIVEMPGVFFDEDKYYIDPAYQKCTAPGGWELQMCPDVGYDHRRCG